MSIEEQDFTLNVQGDSVLDACFAKLARSPSARAMLDDAMERGWMMCLRDLANHDFHIDIDEQVIELNTHGLSESSLAADGHFHNSLLVSMICSLRDVWQENRHGNAFHAYAPDDILMVERIKAADCDVMTVLIAWELRNEGMVSLWRHLMASEESDLAMVFSGHLERGNEFYTASLHEAMYAAFQQWYRSDARIKACDHDTLNYMDDVMSDCHNVCNFGDKRLHPIMLEALSCLPDRTAYLKGMGRELMMDPFYAGLGDEINQAHFVQIMHDLKATYVEGVAFRDAALAAKIFPVCKEA